MSASPTVVAPQAYYIVSPNGRKLEVTKAIFDVFEDVMRHRDGVIEVDVRNGGIAGARGTKRYK